MSEELIKSVQDMLKEETWTRAAISNYSKEKLIELAAIVEKARNENCSLEIQQLCDDQLAHSKDSIIALYISGMISLHQGNLDNTNLVTLVDVFQKNHKENVVEYLCTSILEDDPANKFALRTLAEYYRSSGNEKVWLLYAQIVKLDFEEADLAKALAEHAEEGGDTERAVEFYKKAILRYVNAGNINAIKELWTKLIKLIPSEIDFFSLVKRKVSKTLGETKTDPLLRELYNWYKDNKKWDIAISLLKEILQIDAKDDWARNQLADCYRGKYEGRENLDNYIIESNLTASYRNVFEAISDFEKHIAFDAKNYVYHKSWGVGKIIKAEKNKLTINFGKKTGVHEMSLQMAINALTPLPKTHIWVKKATTHKEDLAKEVKEDKTGTLKRIIRSFDNSCDFKRIKAELVPSILTPGEWTSWNTAAKKILESDPQFGVNPNDINMYMVRDKEISKEEKLANEFKAQKQFFSRIDIIMKFIDSDETDKTSEMFADMFNYFAGYVKSLEASDSLLKVNEQTLAAYLVVQNIISKNKSLAIPQHVTFQQIYEKISDPREMYTLLKDTKNTTLHSDYLRNIRTLPDWADEYIRLFPTVLDESMLDTLIDNGYKDKVLKLVRECFENCKDYRKAVIFLFKECSSLPWYNEAGVSYEKQLIALIQLIEITFRERDNHVNSTENMKINKNATDLLFKNDALMSYMFQNGEDTVKKMYTLIDDITKLDPSYKATLRNKILEKYPDFKFHVSEEKTAAPQGMLVTAKKLAEKKALLEQIENVELPAVGKEIGEAKEKGDLKENAEFKAAKEHQHKLQKDAAYLQSELNRATIFDPTTITTAYVSFATIVTLHDNLADKDETYTILGPWESDPDNNIISYVAPFGNALLNAKVGDNLKFKINEYAHDVTIKTIKPAKL